MVDEQWLGRCISWAGLAAACQEPDPLLMHPGLEMLLGGGGNKIEPADGLLAAISFQLEKCCVSLRKQEHKQGVYGCRK